MVGYLTSSESLERLCEIQPDQPIKYGVLKTLSGLGLGGVAAASGWGCWAMRDMVTNAYDGFELGIGIALEAIVGVIGLASAGGSLYMLSDGVTSLGKPFGLYFRDGSTYYRNRGFTNKPSLSDKKFGTKVNPIEAVEEFNLNDEGYVLVNGIFVQHTDLKSESKIRMIPIVTSTGKTTITTYIPQPYTEYTAVLDGELKGEPLRVFTVTGEGNFAESLAEKRKGSAIYTMGSLDKNRDIDLKQFGDAFSR